MFTSIQRRNPSPRYTVIRARIVVGGSIAPSIRGLDMDDLWLDRIPIWSILEARVLLNSCSWLKARGVLLIEGRHLRRRL